MYGWQGEGESRGKRMDAVNGLAVTDVTVSLNHEMHVKDRIGALQ